MVEVEIPLKELKIANFTGLPEDHFVNSVFSYAEKCNLPERNSDNYTFSQAVGSIVRGKYDGMIVPGVRGKPGAHYCNVVLFKKLDEWQTWVSNSIPPYRYIDNILDQVIVAAFYNWIAAKAHDPNLEHGHESAYSRALPQRRRTGSLPM